MGMHWAVPNAAMVYPSGQPCSAAAGRIAAGQRKGESGECQDEKTLHRNPAAL